MKTSFETIARQFASPALSADFTLTYVIIKNENINYPSWDLAAISQAS